MPDTTDWPLPMRLRFIAAGFDHTTIDDAQHEIAAAGTLKVTGASGVTCEVYVSAIRVA